jgi:hypothetical protein
MGLTRAARQGITAGATGGGGGKKSTNLRIIPQEYDFSYWKQGVGAILFWAIVAIGG